MKYQYHEIGKTICSKKSIIIIFQIILLQVILLKGLYGTFSGLAYQKNLKGVNMYVTDSIYDNKTMLLMLVVC